MRRLAFGLGAASEGVVFGFRAGAAPGFERLAALEDAVDPVRIHLGGSSDPLG